MPMPSEATRNSCGFAGGNGDRGDADLSCHRQAADNGKHDQTKHIIDHRSAKDDARLLGSIPPQISQDARGNSNAGCRKNAADEKIRGKSTVWVKHFHRSHAQDHGQNDAQNRDVGGIFAHALHLYQANLQADEEQQHKYREARNNVDEGVDGNVALPLRP